MQLGTFHIPCPPTVCTPRDLNHEQRTPSIYLATEHSEVAWLPQATSEWGMGMASSDTHEQHEHARTDAIRGCEGRSPPR